MNSTTASEKSASAPEIAQPKPKRAAREENQTREEGRAGQEAGG
jgi:hypothetical protein